MRPPRRHVEGEVLAVELGGVKRPRSAGFGKDVNLPKERPKPAPVRPVGAAKQAGGRLAKIQRGMSRLKGR